MEWGACIVEPDFWSRPRFVVHASQIADHFIKDANKVVKIGLKAPITVTKVDLPRQRFALSMKSKPDFEKKERKPGDTSPRPQGQNPGGGGQRGNFSNDRDRNSRPQQGGGMAPPSVATGSARPGEETLIPGKGWSVIAIRRSG